MKQLTNSMLNSYNNNELINLKQNILDYIVPLDKNNIRWKILNYSEMEQFIKKNYKKDNEYVWWFESGEKTLLGMTFIPFPPYNEQLKFLVGTVKNNLNKETIIGCISYCDNFYLGSDYDCLTYIETVEINYFYQELGLLNIMLNEFSKVITKEQNIVMTFETLKGRLCHIMNHLKDNLKKFHFKRDVRFSHELTDDYMKTMIKKQ